MTAIKGFEVNNTTYYYQDKNIAEDFSENITYKQNDIIFNDGKLYITNKNDYTSTDWSDENWSYIEVKDKLREINNHFWENPNKYPNILFNNSYYLAESSNGDYLYSTFYSISTPAAAIKVELSDTYKNNYRYLIRFFRQGISINNFDTVSTFPTIMTANSGIFLPTGSKFRIYIYKIDNNGNRIDATLDDITTFNNEDAIHISRYELIDSTLSLSGVAADAAATGNMIASYFDETKTYNVGDYVNYNGTLYRFIADHTADIWIGTDAQVVVLSQDVNTLKGTFEKACFVRTATTSFYTQGGITVNGEGTSNSNRCRCKVPGIDNGAIVRFDIKSGYQILSRAYTRDALNTAYFAGTPFPWRETSVEFTPVAGYTYYLVIRKTDDSDLAPADIPSDLLTITVYENNTDTTLTVEGKPADSQAVGARLSEGIASVNRLGMMLSVNSNMQVTSLYAEQGIWSDTGLVFFSSPKNARTGILVYTEPLICSLGLGDYRWHCWSYSNGNISDLHPTHSNTNSLYVDGTQNLFITKEDTDKYFCVNFIRKDGTAMTTDTTDPDSDLSKILAALKFYRATDTDLTRPGIAADAKVVGDYLSSFMAQAVTVGDTAELVWEQGGIYQNGKDVDAPTVIRTVGYVKLEQPANKFRVECPEGYKWEYREYKYNNIETSIADWITGNDDVYATSEYSTFRFVLTKSGGGYITPEELPEGFTVTATQDTNILTDSELIKCLSEDGSSVNLIWEQGTLRYNDGVRVSATNRIRTKYYYPSDSLRYIYINVPEGYWLGVRIYAAEQGGPWYKSLTLQNGSHAIRNIGAYIYKFILAKSNDSDITIDDLPSDLKIIPVYLSIWDKNATGLSVGPYVTARNNPTNVQAMIDVAETYYDQRWTLYNGNKWIYNVAQSVLEQSEPIEIGEGYRTYGIDCSTYVGLVLRGIGVDDTPFVTQQDKNPQDYLENPAYSWSVNPYDYENKQNLTDDHLSPIRRAAPMAQWFIDQRREVVKDSKLANLEVGDVLFWATYNEYTPWDPFRFMFISHVGFCHTKKRVRPYSDAATYAVGDKVLYDPDNHVGYLYKCTTEISTAEDWDASHWDDLNTVWDYDISTTYDDMTIKLYDASDTYSIGDIILRDPDNRVGYLYECTMAIETPETWDAAHWDKRKRSTNPLVYQVWDYIKYPFCHTVIEAGQASPCLYKSQIVERDWEKDDVTDTNINTLAVIARPDLGGL